jgi:Carboxypeptidase regulatory-like domain
VIDEWQLVSKSESSRLVLSRPNAYSRVADPGYGWMTKINIELRGWMVETSLAIGALLLLVSGCGASDRGGIRGSILRKDGTPLAGARVVARSLETGESAYATTDANGRFDMGSSEQSGGVSAGDYDGIVLENRGDPDSRRPLSISEKYREPSSSGLSVSVRSGESQEMNLKLDPP